MTACTSAAPRRVGGRERAARPAPPCRRPLAGAVRLLGDQHDDGVGGHHARCGVGIRPESAAASTSTTSPGRTRSSSAVSARCSGTTRASGPGGGLGEPRTEQPHIGEHLAAAGRPGEGRPDDGVRSRTENRRELLSPSGFRAAVGGGQFDAGSQVAGGDDDVGAARRAGRGAARRPPARTTSAPAATRRAATVRAQSGRRAWPTGSAATDSSDSPMRATLGSDAPERARRSAAGLWITSA